MITISVSQGIINIEGDGLEYFNIRDIYKTCNGNLLESDFDQNKTAVLWDLLTDLSESLYLLDDVLNDRK